MKVLIICIILLISAFSPVSAQSQSRFGNCVPGYIDIVVGGTFFHHVPMQCLDLTFVNEPGYLPINQQVAFEYLTKSYTGSIIGYQFIWKPDNSIVAQYLIYVPSLGYELNVDSDLVRAS